MFFGGGGIPFGMDGDMPGGMGGMGRSREPADTQALYDVLGVTKKSYSIGDQESFSQTSPQKTPGQRRRRRGVQEDPGGLRGAGRRRKRSKYDQYGLEGLEGGDMPEGMDIFDMFFGGGRRRRGGGGKRKAEDTVYPLKVSLEDLYNGKTAKLAITRNVMKGEPRKCSTCRGQGVVIQMRQIGPGMVQQLQARCPDCSVVIKLR